MNGYALGGGCELTMACDIRRAACRAKLGQSEVKLGIIPSWGGTQRLARLGGQAKVKELIFTGDMLTAEEALKIGLVNQIVANEELLARAHLLAEKNAGKPQLAIQFIKEAVDNEM
ncbi:MAG: enoyl-CoA hydratase-related protein [Desulfuromusa sp.]|nr:enoyl-CoA hydratase-related protein [Desulfuromusa sp.]